MTAKSPSSSSLFCFLVLRVQEPRPSAPWSVVEVCKQLFELLQLLAGVVSFTFGVGQFVLRGIQFALGAFHLRFKFFSAHRVALSVARFGAAPLRVATGRRGGRLRAELCSIRQRIGRSCFQTPSRL